MEESMKNNIMKTGTTTIGIVYKEGILLAADRRATAGNMIANKKAITIAEINNHLNFIFFILFL